MPIPYNCFGTGGHRRWVVSGYGSSTTSKYCWTEKLVPTQASDWNGPFTFPSPVAASGYNASHIEYDPDRDMLMVVGTIAGVLDAGDPTSYPNNSPYIIRSYDMGDTWTEERPMHVEWLNVEPNWWGGFSTGHLHYDPLRSRMWMFGGQTFSSFFGRPDTSDHVSYSDDGGDTWTTFASQKEQADDDWGWGNSSWPINQRRPPHFQLATGGTIGVVGYVVARVTSGTNNWLVALGGLDPDGDPDVITYASGYGPPSGPYNHPRDFPAPAPLTDATNRISRDFWSISPQLTGPGWIVGNQRSTLDTHDGSIQYTDSSTISTVFWRDDIPDAAMVRAVITNGFEGDRYDGQGPSSGALRHGRFTVASGRIWSHTGWAGTELNNDALVSSASGTLSWRRDQDFRLALPDVDGPSGNGAFRQHHFFDDSKLGTGSSGAVHKLAQNRANSDVIMAVGRMANIARYTDLDSRFRCFCMSEDGGSTWNPPGNLPSGMDQPYHVFSV